jgi:hypothetical protein
MTHPLVAELEQAFQEVRNRDLPLGERLKFVADRVRAKGPGGRRHARLLPAKS